MKTLVSRKRLVKTFCELVRIKSPSGQEEEIAINVIERLEELGIFIDRDSYGNVIAKISGPGKPLILCAHLDTVAVGSEEQINPVIKQEKGEERIKSIGNTILGADNKDYITAILEMLIVVKENNLSRRALEIVFTVKEEKISEGAKELFEHCSLLGKECLISDSPDSFGTITLSAPYCGKFKVSIYGKSTHAKNPEDGINAIDIAVKTISELPLGKINRFTTTNIGFIFGGLKGQLNEVNFKNILDQACNTVPDRVNFCGEIRSLRRNEFEEISNMIREILKRKLKKGRIKFSLEELAKGYSHRKNDTFINRIVTVLEKQRIKPKFINAIGGSDANAFNANGIKTVVISSAHRNNHQISEYLIINDLVRLTDFLVRFVTQK